MDLEAYKRVCEWFRKLVDLPAEEQKIRLDELRSDDEQLARELEQMIAADAQANESHFLMETGNSEIETTQFKQSGAKSNDEIDQLVGSFIRDYRLEQQIGAGGMGVVYRAYDLNGQRDVAIKLIRAGSLAEGEQVQRFRAEAIAAARMQHPNIVPVHEVGRVEGHEFFTMSLVEGGDLKQRLKRGPLSSRQTAQLFLKIARALQYAHERDVVHRDIKPANILLDENQEPLLTDFGIAKLVNSGKDQTGTGQMLGTAVYMAPEQITDSKSVGSPADIYSLGATMYECLTGKAPFDNKSVVQLLSDVRNRMPASIRTTRPDVDQEIESICMRCLQKDPAERYESAEQLGDDLARYLAGEPLAATPLTRWKSIGRVLGFREQHGPLDSAGAAFWIFLISVTFHPVVFLLNATDQSPILLWLMLAVWGCVAGTVNYRYHWQQYWRLSSAERQSGMIFLAINLSFASLFFIHGPLSTTQPISDFLEVYPPFCLVVAVGICAHAGIHAGRWMVYGAFFIPLALTIARFPYWGPLLFGVVGTLIAAIIDRDLRSSAKVRSENAPDDVEDS